MSVDIAERLRAGGAFVEGAFAGCCDAARAVQPSDLAEAAAEIERLRAELASRDGEIAAWLRCWAYERWRVSDDGGETWLTGAADGVEAGEYCNTQKTV